MASIVDHCRSVYGLDHTVDRSLFQNAILQNGDGHRFHAVLDHTLRLDLLSVDEAGARADSSSVRAILFVWRLTTGAARAAAGELVELIVEVLIEDARSAEEVRLREEVRFERVTVEEVLEQVVRIAEAEALLEREEVVLEMRVALEAWLVREVAVSERSAVVRSSLVVQVALVVGALLFVCGEIEMIG